MERGRLLLGGRAGEEGFGILGEEVTAVRGVEAFWQDDDLGASLGGLQDLLPRMGQIHILIHTIHKLNTGHLHGLLEHRRGGVDGSHGAVY